MSLKEWKNAELNRNLMKKWGLLKEEVKKPDDDGDKIPNWADKNPNKAGGDEDRKPTNESEDLDEEQAIFAPNHYCVHHGGVQHEGQIKMAEAISHNFDKKLNKVTWYDMKLQDGTILEQVAAEDIQVTNATLESMHGSHRVDDKEKIGSRAHNDEEGNRDPSDDEILGLKREAEDKPDFSGVSMAKQKTQHLKTAQSASDAKYSELLKAVREHFAQPGTQATGNLKTLLDRVAQEMAKRAKAAPKAAPKGASPKGNQISVREAKEITRRIIERIKKESK